MGDNAAVSARHHLAVLCVSMAVIAAACSSGGDEDAAPTTSTTAATTTSTTEATTTTTEATTTTSTTVAETTTTTAQEGPVTPPDVLAADGITTPEDASVFVVTSWIAGDRDSASRHAEPTALDRLFAATPPAAETLELIECDTADLIRYDCFFTANGRIIIIGVERLRIIEASIDAN